MSTLQNKIDFAVVISCTKANPNGDPLNGNRPRENFDGYGEISDVCIKRKIRNRMMDLGYAIFVQSDDKNVDGFKSLSERAANCAELKDAGKDKDCYAKAACEKWFDVRSFGQVFAFKAGGKGDGVSVGVRGPVSVRTAVSSAKVEVSTMQITKSVNSETKEGGKSSDTMGSKHMVEFGVYTIYGSINCQLAEKTGFSEEDANAIKECLRTLFENDSSSARPDGSMEVKKLFWWQHNCKAGQFSSAKVHQSLNVTPLTDTPKSFEDFKIELNELNGLNCDEIDGI